MQLSYVDIDVHSVHIEVKYVFFLLLKRITYSPNNGQRRMMLLYTYRCSVKTSTAKTNLPTNGKQGDDIFHVNVVFRIGQVNACI